MILAYWNNMFTRDGAVWTNLRRKKKKRIPAMVIEARVKEKDSQ